MSIEEFIRGKQIVVTGGTGSFGHQIVSRLLTMEPARVVVFSRDENKQHTMRLRYEDNPILDFVIGDVRNYDSVDRAMEGADLCFNAAALKQVPSCEFNPLEAVMTNVLGADNVRRAAVKHKLEAIIGVSTDKAVKPVNAMGMSKALQEKVFLNPNNLRYSTRTMCVRYGNVVASRGSAVPYFIDWAMQGKPLPITDPRMTRFLLTLPEAIDLVLQAIVHAQPGQLWVRKMPGAKITDVAEAVGRVVAGRENYPTKIIGVRPGEKIHEVLVSEEEMHRATELDDYFVIWPVQPIKTPTPTKPGSARATDLAVAASGATVGRRNGSNGTAHRGNGSHGAHGIAKQGGVAHATATDACGIPVTAAPTAAGFEYSSNVTQQLTPDEIIPWIAPVVGNRNWV
jgi:UDP-glucose 4-epimerase